MIAEHFNGTKWKKEINVRDFVIQNFTPYFGDESFLEGITERTGRVKKKLNELLSAEHAKGGVLDVDTTTSSSILSYKPGYISKEDEIIVGLQTDAPLKRAVNCFGGLRMAEQACKEYGYELDNTVVEKFKYRTTHNDAVFRAYTDEMRRARRSHILTGLPDSYGRGRLIGDYRRLALYGMDFLMEQKKKDKESLGCREMTDYNIRTIEEVAKQLSFMQELKALAADYGLDISQPAQNAREAIQWTYFAFLGCIKEHNGAANSFGRVDAFFDIFIEKDMKEGKLTEKEAQELIDDFVIKLRMVRHLRTPEYNTLFAGDPTWVTLASGGLATNGKPLVTKTTYRILHTLYNLGQSSEPNITILWSRHLPETFKKFCAKVSIDTDSIQYENDDLMRVDYGDDYAISCCVSAMKLGKQMQFFGARCNVAKLLLLSLNGGKDELSGEQVGPITESFPEGMLSYDMVIGAYRTYSKWLAGLYVNTMNLIHYMHDRYAYERLTMSFHDTDPDKLMAFGIAGLSVLVDSLSAIKYAKVKAVKDERGIITDFEVEGDFPKFGNDDDQVDEIAKMITEDFYNNLCQTRCYKNAKHTLSVLTITANVAYGKNTGNTPDGRRQGEPFAPGANPMHGRDTNGALASLNSVAKLDYCNCHDGISNTFTVIPNVLGANIHAQIDNLVSLLDGYFNQNGHHLNVNVLNRDYLIDAMEHPEKYPNLTIRVSGYAVNFNKLTRKQQEEVIARTFHCKI